MEPRKITGGTVDLGDGQPLVDVDTAVLALHDELTRIGRRRDAAALAALINVASTEQQPWAIYENEAMLGAGRPPRQIQTINRTARVIVLEAIEEDEVDDASSD